MLNIISWNVQKFKNKTYITNNVLWVEWFYLWHKTEWYFYLYPYLDDNKKTVIYYIFDTMNQKYRFEEILKINGIWAKTAFQIVQIPEDKLNETINSLDTKFFQSIPGIWPKSAKKILIELKWTFEVEDIQNIDIDQKLYKDIIKSLKWLGYDVSSIKSTLQKYDWKISKENMTQVIKRVISQM